MSNNRNPLKRITDLFNTNKSKPETKNETLISSQHRLPANREFKDQLYTAAESAYESKKYKEAIESLNTLIELDPGFEKAYDLRMKSKYSLREYAGVIEDATRGIRLKGNDPSNYFVYRSYSYYAIDKQSEAEEDAEKAISQLHALIAKKKLKNKDYQGAITEATNSINYNFNKTAEAYLTRAKAKFELMDYDGAIADALELTKKENSKCWDMTLKKMIEAFTLASAAYQKLNKQSDALKYQITAFKLKKTIEPLSLLTLCKFFIFENHGKIVAASPKFNGDFDELRSVLANNDITPEKIYMVREISQLPTKSPDLFVALSEEEERRSRVAIYEKSLIRP